MSIATIEEYSQNGSFSVNYKFTPVETTECEFGTIEIGETRVFGTLMFLDQEIQISSRDMHLYHETMVQLAVPALDDATNILVVGDGDGGFTNYDWAPKADWVERSQAIMDIGAKYFGANWDNVRTIYNELIEDFVPREGTKYDVLFLAISDDFNRESLASKLQEIEKLVVEGGTIVAQVGCAMDVNFDAVHSAYSDYLESRGYQSKWDNPFIPTFLSSSEFVSWVTK